MDISLRNLKLINVIVKEGSITKAADKLFLSQPALSHQLKKFEDEIGLNVFTRINKKLILTETGKILYHNSEKLLASMNILNSELLELKEGSKKVFILLQSVTPVIIGYQESLKILNKNFQKPMFKLILMLL